MKKHEHQTSRSEKISDFFGGSNFMRLNNYNHRMTNAYNRLLLMPL